MKVSKVVLIVVALHVLVIGGFLLFEAFNPKTPVAPDIAGNESLPGDPAAAVTDPLATAPVTAPTPSVDGLTVAQPGSLPPSDDISTPLTTTPGSVMPPAVTEPVAAPAPSARMYTVKKGDSLWKISRAEGVSMTELAEVNNLTKTKPLQIGQQLQLPAATTADSVNIATGGIVSSGTSPSIAGDVAASPGLYMVKKGDSLWKVARNNGTTVKAIKEANQLASDSLKIGQKIRLPAASAAPVATASAAPSAPATSGSWNINSFYEPGRHDQNGQVIHAVDNGETIDVIARNYGVRAADIIQANPKVNPTKLYYGQPLVIPQAQAASALPTATAEPSAMLTTPAM